MDLCVVSCFGAVFGSGFLFLHLIFGFWVCKWLIFELCQMSFLLFFKGFLYLFGFEFCGKIWVFLLWLWLGLKEGEEPERRDYREFWVRERKLTEGLMVLRVLRTNMSFRDLMGQFWNVLDLSSIFPNLRVVFWNLP